MNHLRYSRERSRENPVLYIMLKLEMKMVKGYLLSAQGKN